MTTEIRVNGAAIATAKRIMTISGWQVTLLVKHLKKFQVIENTK